MVENSEVRQHCPSVSFFFTRLGAYLGSFSSHCPPIEGFVSRDSSLGLVLVDLYPLLHQSLNWFREMMSEVRSSELETGLSFSDDPVEVEVDTPAFGPSSSGQREIRFFHTLKEECALDADTLFRFTDRFQFLKEVKI